MNVQEARPQDGFFVAVPCRLAAFLKSDTFMQTPAMKALLHLPLFFLCLGSLAQNINPALLKGGWPAPWVSAPGIPQRDYAVLHFRKMFRLTERPDSFVVHVSADNRYRLFVNGKDVCNGPARGDLANWYFETVDIARFLKPGDNLIAAVVWNMGVHAPVAQISNQTAFLLQGNGKREEAVNTGRTWKVYRNPSYSPCSLDNDERLRSYMVVGPGDRVDASAYPWGWEKEGFSDDAWMQAVPVGRAVPTGYGTDNLWTLIPRDIPLMREERMPIRSVRRTEGMTAPPSDLGKPIEIPANRKVSLLLDQGHLTVAYPELTTGGGKGAEVRMTYAEALFAKDGSKGNRDSIEGKTIIGNYDVFLPDGGVARTFRPLWFRTYRYLQIDIATGAEPLVVKGLSSMATGYPFEVKASFRSDDASHQGIWDVGWRTAQLCAGETYFDCPYYEQLQYEGDTRIQSLISLYVTGDDRLMRKAILDFHRSRVPEGLTQGRYPSSRLQVIPPFSLFWVSMVHDYWMHRKDDAFVGSFQHAIDGVMGWFSTRMDTGVGMLGPLSWWNFVDWNLSFPSGVPDGATDGHSSVVSLQFAYTLRQAAEMAEYFGRREKAAEYRRLAEAINRSTFEKCFDSRRGAMANTPERKTFSQHASILSILSVSIPDSLRKTVMENILRDQAMSQATFYFRFYLTRAMRMAGMADLYPSSLGPWRQMIANGLTTFAENPDPTRSDCHAWSSSPNYDFLATVCGIMPSAPGFSEVRIEPALGELRSVEGSMPHPNGPIRVAFKRNGGEGLIGTVELPTGLTGQILWKGTSLPLKSGTQSVDF